MRHKPPGTHCKVSVRAQVVLLVQTHMMYAEQHPQRMLAGRERVRFLNDPVVNPMMPDYSHSTARRSLDCDIHFTWAISTLCSWSVQASSVYDLGSYFGRLGFVNSSEVPEPKRNKTAVVLHCACLISHICGISAYTLFRTLPVPVHTQLLRHHVAAVTQVPGRQALELRQALRAVSEVRYYVRRYCTLAS